MLSDELVAYEFVEIRASQGERRSPRKTDRLAFCSRATPDGPERTNIIVDAPLPIHHSREMDASRAITIMSALAQATRLRTYRLLVETGGEGLASGEIAAAVGAPQNTMSSHLTILTHAGLVKREQQGRVVRYRALLDEVAELGAFLIK